MPRGPRLDAPGCAHHVMVRGIEGRRIFLGDEDRLDFLRRLELLLPEEQWRCFAWALMPNHVHLVVKSSEGGLSRLMARLNTGFARGFNRRHTRTGYLFESRFKSRLAENEADLMGLLLYVNSNPLAAGLVDSLEALEHYPWCGHSALVGRRAPLAFESIGASLSLFADDEAEARRRLRARMRDRGFRRTPEGASDCGLRRQVRVHASAARSVPAAPGRFPSKARHIPLGVGRSSAVRIEELISGASQLFGVSADEVRSPCQRRAAARARAVVAHLAVDEFGLPGKAVADALRVSPSAVSHALRRGRAVVEREGIRITSPAEDLGREGD